MNKKYNLKLDLQFRCNNSTMKFNQFDNNTSDFFMRITNGGKLVDIEKAIVVLAVIKPNKEVDSQFVEVENGVVYANLKPSMKDEIGIYTARAMLILESEKVVTDVVNYEVEEDKIFSLLNDTVETTEEFTLLTDMLSRLSTIELNENNREETFNNIKDEFEIIKNNHNELVTTETDNKVTELLDPVVSKANEKINEVDNKIVDIENAISEADSKINNAIAKIPPKSELIGEKGDKGEKGEKGDKGDRGEQGLQGIQGIQGIQGERGLQGVKGDKGDKGEQGIQGLKGDKGDKGDRGEQGVKGDTPSITHLETSINNKIQEVETRFNTLTSTQQQDAEVIDARDGEVSLKARLDRDVEKAKQVYVNVEGSNISTDSSSGYLKDVEIKGNTIQDASNLADIRSVGDKVEGQELYEIPVVSYGKNLLKIPDSSGTSHGITFTSKDGLVTVNGTNTGYIGYDLVNGVASDKLVSYSLVQSIIDYYNGVPNFINKPGNYIIKVDTNVPVGELTFSVNVLYDDDVHKSMSNINSSITNPFHISVDSHINGIYIGCWYSGKTFNNVQVKLQIEEGTVATPYEPYVEDKLTILSPVQLEKVGDVADRLIEKDGVWGVEKNVGVLKFKEYTQSLNAHFKKDSVYRFSLPKIINTPSTSAITTFGETSVYAKDIEGVAIDKNTGNVFIQISYTNLNIDINSIATQQLLLGATSFIERNNVEMLYIKSEPQFIPLPHDQQVKLRTFANKTNISFLTEIEGTIKAQVPKSIGATVNTHTEQINNLNKELDRVKKLEESTVSTVTTESDFTTVEATSNGYFEDVKLEGKTLVNLFDKNKSWTQGKHKGVEGQNLYKQYEVNKSSNNTYHIIASIGDKTSNSTDARLMIYAYNTVTNSSSKLILDSSNNSNDSINKVITLTNDEVLLFNCWDISEDKFNKNYPTMMILEGDHTQNPPSYFEGLKSVGQETDEIVVSSVNENLFDDSVLSFKLGVNVRTDYIPFKLKHKEIGYMAFNEDLSPYTNSNFAFRLCDKSKKEIQWFGFSANETTMLGKTCERFKEVEYIQFFTNGNMTDTHTISNFVITKDNTKIYKTYIPHQSDKKRLLCYNEETQTWEKPILREWDSIEKHTNGKYYYHQRSGEVVLNGSEDWEDYDENSFVNRQFFKDAIGNTTDTDTNKAICNRFVFGKVLVDTNRWQYYNNGSVVWSMFAKKTGQTLEQFKSELQTNNVTVVYQLAQEKVYECTNIDLITYEGETNYIVESGAIVPRTTLKVHNNISNVVSLLQKKVSLLESNITRYTITQNRLMLTSRYNADTVGFKVDVATLRNSFEYDNDLYELILNNILVGKDNYDREYIENLIIFYWMDFVISDEMHSALFEIIEEQHNPKVIEDEEAPL